MRALIIPQSEISKFPIWNKEDDSQWIPLNNTVSGDYWLQLDAQSDLNKSGIKYRIGEVEIKQEEWQQI